MRMILGHRLREGQRSTSTQILTVLMQHGSRAVIMASRLHSQSVNPTPCTLRLTERHGTSTNIQLKPRIEACEASVWIKNYNIYSAGITRRGTPVTYNRLRGASKVVCQSRRSPSRTVNAEVCDNFREYHGGSHSQRNVRLVACW